MGLIVNTNVAAMTAQRNLKMNTRNVTESLERLATGYRINKASDDIAGLNISEILRTQIRGYQVAIRNAQDGVSLLQIAEGGYQTITENVQRIRELTVQAANGTYSTTERTAIAREVYQRMEDIDRIATTIKFNNTELLSGNTSEAVLQIGANNVAVDTLDIAPALQTMTSGALGLSGLVDATVAAGGAYENATAARTYLDTLDAALETIFERRTQVGAYSQRLDSVINNLEITVENLTASESRIRDLDIAEETTRLTRNQVLQQATTSVLAQANQLPLLALSLLG
jgi:flagellin